MKKIFQVAALLALCGIFIPSEMMAQKVKKEKKPFVWEMPKLTNNANFDEYLLTCDTLHTRIRAYNESIVYYDVKYVKIVDEAGNVLLNEDGQPEVKAMILDKDGNVRNTGNALLQYTDFILSGTNIVVDCANLSLLTASATLELPSLGFSALTYGKHLKAGPNIVAMGGTEIKEIVTSCKSQAKQIRDLRKGSTETGELKDVVMSVGNLEGIDVDNLPTMTNSQILADAQNALGEAAINEDIDIDSILDGSDIEA